MNIAMSLYMFKNMITRIKIIAGMNITESRVPQDGAIKNNLKILMLTFVSPAYQ